jgi:hypothetical protein
VTVLLVIATTLRQDARDVSGAPGADALKRYLEIAEAFDLARRSLIRGVVGARDLRGPQ